MARLLRRASNGLRATRVRGGGDGDGEAGHGEAGGVSAAEDELGARQRRERMLNVTFVLTDARDEIQEGRGGATAGQTEEGAKDGDLGAHGCHYVQH